MMKNRHLSKAVASQKFYEFVEANFSLNVLENGIELRIADRFYLHLQRDVIVVVALRQIY